jgi:basic amino acid/polyamine antiporter, APA family
VENASKVIPRAIVIGTFCVVLVYLLNSIGIMGLISGPELATAKAPYVDATQRIFGGQWHYAISLIAFIICLGTLNAWVLTSGQIILGLAQDRLVPSFLAQKNSFDAPSRGLIISSLGVGAMLIFTADESLTKQVNQIIDISVVSFLFIYLISSLSLLKLSSGRLSQRVIALVSAGFCLWIITQTPVHTLFIASLFTMSGVPVYLWYRLQKSTS